MDNQKIASELVKLAKSLTGVGGILSHGGDVGASLFETKERLEKLNDVFQDRIRGGGSDDERKRENNLSPNQVREAKEVWDAVLRFYSEIDDVYRRWVPIHQSLKRLDKFMG